jgi:hypothetical protein
MRMEKGKEGALVEVDDTGIWLCCTDTNAQVGRRFVSYGAKRADLGDTNEDEP